jgi:hypothetical protein
MAAEEQADQGGYEERERVCVCACVLRPGSTMVSRAKHSPRSLDGGSHPLYEYQGKRVYEEDMGLGRLGTGDMEQRSGESVSL